MCQASLRLSNERYSKLHIRAQLCAAVTTLARRVLQLSSTALCDAPAAIAAKAPALFRGVFDDTTSILDHVSKARGAPWLVPARGENIVSGERNKWRPRRRSYAKQLLLDARGQARLDVSVEALRVVEGAFGVRCDGDASAVFVTSQGLRTPLHSDPEASILIHVHGKKRVLAIPPSQSDACPKRLAELLKLRTTPGSQRRLYLGDDASTALSAVDLISVELDEGDALFLPARWLHDVESATGTVSLAARLVTR